MSEKFEFLSPEWEKAAELIPGSNQAQAPSDVEFSMNVTITPTPFGDKMLSISAQEGIASVEKIHLEDPDVTVKTDYDTAYKLFLEGEMNVVLTAMLEGKITVSGDVAKLLSMAATTGPLPSMPFLEDLSSKLQSITL